MIICVPYTIDSNVGELVEEIPEEHRQFVILDNEAKNFEAYYNLDKTGLENKYVILVDGEVVSKGEDIVVTSMLKNSYLISFGNSASSPGSFSSS